jgi:chromosome segregation ATPase
MAGEALTTVYGELKAAVSEMQTKVDGSDAEKASRAAAVDSAKASLETLVAAEETAKATAAADKEAAAAAADATKKAKADAAACEKDVKSVQEKLATLETTLKESFEPFKETKAGAKDVKPLGKVLVDCGAEVQLAESIMESLKKEKDARGSFGALIESQVEEKLKAAIATATAEVAASEPKTATCAAAVEAATATEAAAVAKKEASATALSEATTAKKGGETTLTAAEKAVTNFEPEMAQAVGSLEDAKESLTAVEEGALAYYTELKTYEPPPPEPEPVPEPVEEAMPAAEPEPVVPA